MTAGTREEVAGVAAAAAADVLDAPRADLCVPAGDDNLVPLAVEGTEGANGPDGRTAVDVDAGPRGEAYRGGETVTAAPGDDAPPGLAGFARALCVPVEDRGVLTVARRRAGGTGRAKAKSDGDGNASVDGFGPAEVACTEVLARNTAVALDNIERVRRLERERDRLDEFAGVISHDLRGPLSAALARVQAARDMVAAGQTEPTRDQLREAESSLERMDELVDDALTLARQGKVAGEREPTPLGRVVEDAWASVRTADTTLVGADRLPTVPADEERARTLFENLFRNSVEHGSTNSRPSADDSVEHGSTSSRASPDDGVDRGAAADPPTVTVEVGPLSDEGGEAGGEGVYVADDGPGIPPENRDRVFERGFTTRDGGSGLGLFIVERVAAAHGWTVTVAESDDGARFEIRF